MMSGLHWRTRRMCGTHAHTLVLQQRICLVRGRTRVHNRSHTLLARQHPLAMPEVSDIFSVKGMAAMQKAPLTASDWQLLDDVLGILSKL